MNRSSLESKYLNLPMAGKLRHLQSLSARMALLLAVILTSSAELWSESNRLLLDAESTGRMIGFNADAALLFNDQAAAHEILQALTHKPEVRGARLYNPAGEAFASYLASTNVPELPEGINTKTLVQNHWMWTSYLAAQTIIHEGEAVGTLYLVYDLVPVWKKLLGYIGFLMIGLLMAFWASIVYVKPLLKQIAAPLERLSALARRVSQEKNYELRAEAEGHGNDEIAQLIQSFNEMIEQVDAQDRLLKRQRDHLEREKIRAEQANYAKGSFLANMSHEIRTPFNAIMGLAELAMDLTEDLNKQSPIVNTLQQYLAQIQQASQSLLIIINDILDFSKIEAGKIELEVHAFDIEAVIKEISTFLISTLGEKPIEFLSEISCDVPDKLLGDSQRLRQILINLLGNSIKFTTEGEILLKVERIKGSETLLRFSIHDTGVGISEAAQDHLFQAFSQADISVSRKYGGTGLGLAISQRLVSLMGGTIQFTSQEGRGSTFEFTANLPAVAKSTEAPKIPNSPTSNILLFDHNPTSRAILIHYLENQGHQIWIKHNLDEIIEFLSSKDAKKPAIEYLMADSRLLVDQGANRIQATLDNMSQPPFLVILIANQFQEHIYHSNASTLKPKAVLHKPIWRKTLAQLLIQCQESPSTHSELSKSKQSQLEAAQKLQGCKILLVDDVAINQQIAKAFLRKAGAEIVLANNGLEAVNCVKSEKFDVVLMDLQMPVMDGFEATRQIRQLPEGQGLPIIAMTAAAMQHDKEACLLAGIDDHLAKPLNSKLLLDTLLIWMQKKPEPTASADRR